MSFKSFPCFPVELVSQILGFLEFQDLLSCSEVGCSSLACMILSPVHRQVCQALRKVVDSSRLRYTIELGMHRMVSLDYTGKGPSFHTRRRLLKDRENSWKHFRWRQKHTLHLPTSGSIYEFVGGFYGNAQASAISFIQLPSATTDPADTPVRTWIHNMPDISFVDFTMDPSQDLLVLLSNASVEYVMIRRPEINS